MKTTYAMVLFLAMLTIATSCDKSLFNAGPTETKEIMLTEGFSLIMINQTFDITLIQDTLTKIRITAGENLQPEINIYVKNQILYLNHRIKNNWSRNYEKVKLELYLPSIPSIQVMEPAHITTRDTFKTDFFALGDWGKFSDVDVTVKTNSCQIAMSEDNFGRFVLRGESQLTNLWARGSCFIYTNDLKTKNCSVRSDGIGDVYVNVSNTLEASLNSTGNVYYYNQPSKITITSQTSTGKLIQLTNQK